jgi:hypothetical protein
MGTSAESVTSNELVKSHTLILKSWEQQKPYTPTVDDVIDAYLKGKKDGFNIQQRVIIEKFNENMNKTTDITRDFLEYLDNKKLKIIEVFLKIVDIDEFELLFLTDESYFNKPELILEAYKKSGEYRLKYNSDTININISFLPKTKEYDRDFVICDGFGLTYVKNK